ncbi:hypothetical protein [Enterobacter hormaechei]|uniref:hypothetical protein n=1 Tax=Enterobacter hormaechei TaxID=158836 RepID=UPI000F84A76B|nr:hypothetical protein [Enterobacter hormaechei]RTQ12842.1 hypothetical protein EKN23_04050 [Enterobacter hormaechei]
MIITLKKCPDEPGELEAMDYGVPSLAVTGLQRNVIGMAFCCKKSVGTSERQLGMNLVPTKSHSNYMGTTVYHGPNVIGLWWPVLISSLLRLPTAGYVATPNPAKKRLHNHLRNQIDSSNCYLKGNNNI